MSSWKLKMVYWKPKTIVNELRSTRPNFVPLLATRCLSWGVCLTKGQPDPKGDQMSSWPDVVPLLVTRCLCLGTSEFRSTWPNLVPLLATRCLYWWYIWAQVNQTLVPLLDTRCLCWGYVWSKVSLTKRLTKCQADLTQYHSWLTYASTGDTSEHRSTRP